MRQPVTTFATPPPDTKLRAILAEVRRRFQRLYGERLVALVLYGSQARGDAEPGSAIDLLVVLRGPVQAGSEIKRTGGLVSDISLDFDEVLTCIFVNDVEFAKGKSPLLLNVRREKILVA
jgi:predicted nucleotidyltransferase